MKLPKISSEWTPLFCPQQYGHYVNDHSIVKATDGKWHLFGITSLGTVRDRSESERYFVHGVGDALSEDTRMREVGIACDNGVRAWAPAVIAHDERYYMYYGPSPTRFATSDELGHWMENQIFFHNTPLDAAHRDHFILKVGESRWLMYVTGIHNRYGVISVFESSDLVNWTFIRYALQTSGNAPLNPPWGATESPYVVLLDGLYYLFMTYTNCKHPNYHDTLVFASEDPLNFGNYTGDNHDELVVAKLQAHAPEILQHEGQWWITTCGWRDMGCPIEGGVGLAKLEWVEEDSE